MIIKCSDDFCAGSGQKDGSIWGCRVEISDLAQEEDLVQFDEEEKVLVVVDVVDCLDNWDFSFPFPTFVGKVAFRSGGRGVMVLGVHGLFFYFPDVVLYLSLRDAQGGKDSDYGHEHSIRSVL